MNGAELKAIRTRLGLSGADMARMLGYEGRNMRQLMYALESGSKAIRKPQERLARAYEAGYRPDDWPT